MYIRRTKTKTADHGEDSYTYRIVESVREGTQVKQRTLLNLGKNFAIEPAHWPLLAARIEQLLQGSAPHQAELFHLADDVGQLLEATAERYSDLIIAKLAQPVAAATPEQDYHRVNINHIEANQARSIGGETLALHAVMQLQLDQKLTALGFNKIDSNGRRRASTHRRVDPAPCRLCTATFIVVKGAASMASIFAAERLWRTTSRRGDLEATNELRHLA